MSLEKGQKFESHQPTGNTYIPICCMNPLRSGYI